MIAKAIEKILELAQPNFYDTAGGVTYSDKQLFPVDEFRRCEALRTTTLSSIVDYVHEFVEKDGFDPGKCMIHIIDHEKVEIINSLDCESKRDVIMFTRATGPRFNFGSFMDNEAFVIKLQTLFVDDESTQKADVLKFAGTVTSGTVKEYGDDGVTQRATIKVGIAEKRPGIVPSPCMLRPYRTFVEVGQPASKFIFRMRETGESVQCALFEADGDAWKSRAMDNIKNYLERHLEGTGITVIM